jgi:ribosomal protein S18 acetylase RimI-like enzyme
MPEDFAIRIARRGDAAPLAAFARRTYTEAFGSSFLPSDLAAHLERTLSLHEVARFIEDDVVLLAARHDALIGFVQFGVARTAPDIIANDAQELRRLYVDSPFQNRGVGADLMRSALSHPRMPSASPLYLEVWEHNHGAQRFYARFGFKVVGTRRFSVDSSDGHELLMCRHANHDR